MTDRTTPLTAAHLAQARPLVTTNIQLTARLTKIRDDLARARALSARNTKLIGQRLDLRYTPKNLAGLAELFQRNPPNIRDRITFEYSWLLRDMIDPLPSIPGPATKPLQIDFHALPLAARPYLIGPYLKVAPGNRFAHVCLARSRPASGHVVLIQPGGPVDADAWRGHLPAISAWLGGNWTLAAQDASTVTLMRREPLPAMIPFNPRHLKRGALFLGIDMATHLPAHIPFAAMSSGTFLPGQSGTGKSNALHVLIASLMANLDQFALIVLCDGKDGVAFRRYEHAHPKVRVIWEERDLWSVTARLVAIMRARNARQRDAGIDNATTGFIALVIDEMPTFTAKPSSDGKSADNKLHAQFLDDLNRIAMRGRSTGLRMLITSQRPVVEQIPASVRANCQTVIGFRLPMDTDATSVYGKIDGLIADPRKLPKGQALVLEGETGAYRSVQLPLMPAQPGGRPCPGPT